MTDALPATGSTNVPINSLYVIIFNIPVAPATVPGNIVVTSYPTATGTPVTTLTEGAAADYELSMNTDNTVLTFTFHYGAGYPLPENTTVGISLSNGILSIENSVPLDTPGIWQFSTGMYPDTAAPTETAHNPTGTGISLTAPNIYIDFNEDICPDSINPSTVYLEDGGAGVPATVAYDTVNRRATLTPGVNLNTSTIYTVTTSAGIRDLAGNTFAGTSWTFTTTATSLDPVPGNPAFVSGPYIDTVSPDGALMTWTTNKPASYILNYGTNSDITDQYDQSIETFPFSDFHSLFFADPPLAYNLSSNSRYWFNIELYDMYAGSNTSMATLEFNTESGETPDDTVHGGTGSQNTARMLPYHPFPSGATGFFLFWYNLSGSNNQIYGQLYDSGLAARWNSPDPHPVFTTGSNTYIKSVEDGLDGVIIIALSNDGNYYAKRIANDGSFYWSHTAASTGYNIGSNTTISNVSSAPVYTGIIQKVTSGTATIPTPLPANPLYDFTSTTNFTGPTIVVGDQIIRSDQLSSNNGTTISDLTNFRHILGQTTARVSAGQSYQIGDSSDTSTPGASANDHLYGFIFYQSGGSTVITPHTNTPFSLGTTGASDIIQKIGTDDYGIISSINTIDFSLGCTSHPFNYADAYEIDLGWSMNFSTSDTFTIYNTITSGTAESPPTYPLYDNTADFTNSTLPLPVASGDIVINYSDLAGPPNPNVAAVNTATGPFPVHMRALNLDANIMADAENYEIVRFNCLNTATSNIIDTGTASASASSHLEDSANSFPAVAIGDIAYNLTDNKYAMVTNVLSNDLTLSCDASFGTNDRYMIIRQRGILFVWQESTGVWGRIVSEDNSANVLISDFWIAAFGTSPHTISDGKGNAFVVYISSTGQIYIMLRDGCGNWIWSLADMNVDSIVDAKSDGANGIVILSKYNNDLYALRINDSGAAVWATPIGFDNDGATTITSQEVMEYVSSDDSVIVTAKDQNNAICTWRTRGTGASAWSYGSAAPLAGKTGVVMRYPQIFYNSGDQSTTIIWEDDRFYNRTYINTGYGVFGQRLNSTGTRTWFPNSGGTNDTNGISVILNHYSDTLNYWPRPLVAAHNNGTEAALIWEDFRTDVVTQDIVLKQDLETFPPW